jgi:hypothetical protein
MCVLQLRTGVCYACECLAAGLFAPDPDLGRRTEMGGCGMGAFMEYEIPSYVYEMLMIEIQTQRCLFAQR